MIKIKIPWKRHSLEKIFPWNGIPWNGIPWKKSSLECRTAFLPTKSYGKKNSTNRYKRRDKNKKIRLDWAHSTEKIK
jgi:hypothetical protein